MKKLIMCKGLPASGKSTWAREMTKKGYKRINRDDLRSMIDDGLWSKKNEVFIVGCRNTLISDAITAGYSVIVDDTNLSPSNETDLRAIAELLNIKFEVKDFTDVPLDICLERDRKRVNSVGKQVIMGMYNKFLKPEIIKVKYDPNLPTAIVCDLDGTIAIHNGRSPYDTEKCDTDLVNPPVVKILESVKPDQLIFCSGREDKYREKTKKWLNSVGFHDFKLLMRKTDDLRNDAIIKKEIYDAEIKGKYNVLFVLDDRDRVVNMWRSEGLTCLQVDEGDF